MYKKSKIFTALLAVISLFMLGCSSTKTLLAGNTAGKNIDISGYLMLGKIETVNSDTATPVGKLLVGRVNYKSRLVAVDKNKQIPITGSFRAVRSVSLFGTGETVIEYDFTAADASTATGICQALEQQRINAENKLSQP